MTDIKAIPTTYRGVKFRSQLEARWAVFFDGMGLKWLYEPQAFNLPAVGGYLPDFRLTGEQGSVFAEVKPRDDSDLSKPRALSVEGYLVLLLVGPPCGDISCYLPGGAREACTLTADPRYSPVYHPEKITRNGVTVTNTHRDIRADLCARDAKFTRFDK